ncbi:MAG: hypothetical protein WC428_02075 [Candidatus Paceibacterota bacterium]|jgi:hypothetical protein
MAITKDDKTGLVYIDEVPFTKTHLKKLRKLFKYAKKVCNGQFKHVVVITDTENQPNEGVTKSVVIDQALINDIFKLYDLKKIARDKRFTK